MIKAIYAAAAAGRRAEWHSKGAKGRRPAAPAPERHDVMPSAADEVETNGTRDPTEHGATRGWRPTPEGMAKR